MCSEGSLEGLGGSIVFSFKTVWPSRIGKHRSRGGRDYGGSGEPQRAVGEDSGVPFGGSGSFKGALGVHRGARGRVRQSKELGL